MPRAASSCIRFLVAAIFAATTAATSADTLVLKNGGQLEGKLKSRTEKEIHFELTQGVAIFPVDQVADVKTGTTVVDELKAKFEALAYTDADGHYALAQWCRSQALFSEMRESLELVIQIAPDHEAARADLGHVRHDGKWLTSPADIEAAGYVRYLGRWYDKAALASLGVSSAQRQDEEKLRTQINDLLRKLASEDGAVRTRAREELTVLSRISAMPQLGELAGQLHKRYDDYYTEQRYVTLELRLTKAEIEKPIRTVSSSIASGSGATSAVDIEVPQISLIKLRTTVTVPAGGGRRR